MNLDFSGLGLTLWFLRFVERGQPKVSLDNGMSAKKTCRVIKTRLSDDVARRHYDMGGHGAGFFERVFQQLQLSQADVQIMGQALQLNEFNFLPVRTWSELCELST